MKFSNNSSFCCFVLLLVSVVSEFVLVMDFMVVVVMVVRLFSMVVIMGVSVLVLIVIFCRLPHQSYSLIWGKLQSWSYGVSLG